MHLDVVVEVYPNDFPLTELERGGRKRPPISAFTMPIRPFTMADFGVRDADLTVRDGLILVFTMPRSRRSRCGDFRTRAVFGRLRPPP